MFFKWGHRGAAGYEPENTMRSFLKALKLGADGLELDIRRAPNGDLIVIHDATLDRTTDGNGPVALWCSPEKLDAGKGERIPYLAEVLREFCPQTIVNIELKEKGLTGSLLDTIGASYATHYVIISAFDGSDNEPGDTSRWSDLLWLKEERPQLKIALLVEKPENLIRALHLTRAYPGFFYAINPPAHLVTNELIREAHEDIHAKIFVWTVDDPVEIRRLKDLGVDGIFSNYPDRL